MIKLSKTPNVPSFHQVTFSMLRKKATGTYDDDPTWHFHTCKGVINDRVHANAAGLKVNGWYDMGICVGDKYVESFKNVEHLINVLEKKLGCKEPTTFERIEGTNVYHIRFNEWWEHGHLIATLTQLIRQCVHFDGRKYPVKWLMGDEFSSPNQGDLERWPKIKPVLQKLLADPVKNVARIKNTKPSNIHACGFADQDPIP